MNNHNTYRVTVHQDMVYSIEVQAPTLQAAIADAQHIFALRGPDPDHGWGIQPQKEHAWAAEDVSG